MTLRLLATMGCLALSVSMAQAQTEHQRHPSPQSPPTSPGMPAPPPAPDVQAMPMGGMMHGMMQGRGATGTMPGMHGPGGAAMMMHCPMMRGMAGRHGGAQGSGAPHDDAMSGSAPGQAGDESLPSLAFRAVNAKMHRDMAIDFTGNVDADFTKAMIAHHQGAIDMAKVAVAFGKDPEVRKLAEEIVRAQEAEIATMRDWLAKQPK